MVCIEVGMIEFTFGKDTYHMQEEIRAWCREHFGQDDYWGVSEHAHRTWYWHSGFGNTHYFFKQEHEASMFALRWS
jgi:hypothetical protein